MLRVPGYGLLHEDVQPSPQAVDGGRAATRK